MSTEFGALGMSTLELNLALHMPDQLQQLQQIACSAAEQVDRHTVPTVTKVL